MLPDKLQYQLKLNLQFDKSFFDRYVEIPDKPLDVHHKQCIHHQHQEKHKELASKLADQHRELHTFSNEQYTELKELSKDEESLKSVPELDETVLKPFTTETEEDES